MAYLYDIDDYTIEDGNIAEVTAHEGIPAFTGIVTFADVNDGSAHIADVNGKDYECDPAHVRTLEMDELKALTKSMKKAFRTIAKKAEIKALI